jgi:hypothetical protein
MFRRLKNIFARTLLQECLRFAWFSLQRSSQRKCDRRPACHCFCRKPSRKFCRKDSRSTKCATKFRQRCDRKNSTHVTDPRSAFRSVTFTTRSVPSLSPSPIPAHRAGEAAASHRRRAPRGISGRPEIPFDSTGGGWHLFGSIKFRCAFSQPLNDAANPKLYV